MIMKINSLLSNSAVVIISFLFLSDYSHSQENYSFWTQESFGKYDSATELVDRRTEFSKHFYNKDGKISAVIGAGPLNYHENGSWKTIYHALEKTNNGFENTTNSHKTYYPKQSAGAIKTVMKDGSVLTDMLNMRMYYLGKNGESQAHTITTRTGTADYNVLTFPGVYGPHIDLKLTHNTTFRKMDYILRNASALSTMPTDAEYLVFEEKVLLPVGWKAVMKDKRIELTNQSGVLTAYFDQPLFYDTPVHSHGQGDHSESAHELIGDYRISQQNNLLTIQTLVPANWLKQDLNFPVYIDPTINLYPNNTTRWTGHHSTTSGTNCYTPGCANYTSSNITESSEGDFWIGRNNTYSVQSGWTKFNITDIPDDACINTAEFRYYVADNSSASSGCVVSTYFRHMAADPSTNDFTVAANNLARLDDIRDGNIFGDYNTAVLVSGTGWRTVNLTANMADLQSQLIPNWFAVGMHTYGGANNHLTCRNRIRGYADANKPILIVTYDPPYETENLTICPEDLPYTWNGQVITSPGNNAATAVVQNSNGCNVTITLNLSTHPGTQPLTDDIAICDSDLPYSWNGQTITAGGTAIATHTTQNANGCDIVTTLNLTVNPTTTLTDDIIICDTDLPYSWNGQTITAGGIAVATHTAPNSNGCDVITSLNLTVNPTSHLTDNQTICQAALPYSWNGQTITAGGTAVATHTTQNANGCDVITTLNLTVNVPDPVHFTTTAEVCLPAAVELIPTNNHSGTCVWTIDGIPVNGDCAGASTVISQAGCYDADLTVTDLNGCVASHTVNDVFCLDDLPVASFDLTNQSNESAATNNTSSHADSYSWTLPNGSTSTEFEPTVLFGNVSGIYSVTLHAYAANGCSDSTTVTVEIIYEIKIPNVITVNGDGVNDFFLLHEMQPNTQLLILNRWGNLVYSSDNYDNSWNGRDLSGNYVSEGVYSYLVTIPDGTKYHGFVHVVH